MDRSFRVITFLFLAVLSAVVFASSSSAEPIDVEDIQDPVLKEQIIRRTASLVTAADAGEEEIDGREPSGETLAAERRLPYPLCGTFILCERKGFFPDAQLFTSTSARVFPKTAGSCRTAVVRGTSGPPANTQGNHALLWKIFGEEFSELCRYTERQHACFTGTVTVQDSNGDVLYECNSSYDAHTVEFCLSKYPYFCRYRNPAEVEFATFSTASS